MAEQLATILPSPLQHKERGGKNSLPTNLPLCAHWLVHLFKLGGKDHLLVFIQNWRTRQKKEKKKPLAKAHSQILLWWRQQIIWPNKHQKTVSRTCPSYIKKKRLSGQLSSSFVDGGHLLWLWLSGSLPLVSDWHELNGTDRSGASTEANMHACSPRTNGRKEKRSIK